MPAELAPPSQIGSPSPPSASARVETPTLQPPEIDRLKALLLDLINSDRSAAGLEPVIWDDTAAAAGQAHAETMAHLGFFSHWNPAGFGPDHRYSAAGGLDVVAENIHTVVKRFDDDRPAPIKNWDDIIRQGQSSLMDSPGHRRNILDPIHTHVGVGLAYNPVRGQFWLTQEFVNRYVELQPLPATISVGQTHQVQGQLLRGVSEPVINLAYEPFPRPLSIAQLNATSTYSSSAEIFEAITSTVDADGSFTAQLRFDRNGEPGLYHIRVWVTIAGHTETILAADVVVTVER